MTIPGATYPDEFPDFNEFCEFVENELGDIPVLDQGTFISPKIRYYWSVWRNSGDLYKAKKQWHQWVLDQHRQGIGNGTSA